MLFILRKETAIYRELMDVILLEKKILLSRDVDKLTANNFGKETLILKVKVLEEARWKAVKKISGYLHLGHDDVSLSVLISHVEDGELSREMSDCQSELRALIEGIQKLNRHNMIMMDSSLSSIRGCINFINGLMCSGSTYVGTGGLSVRKRNGKLLYTEG